ncbi:MAG: hypothetical protein IKF14_14895 [Atopobiaceae bacterium]|nr:hypothetical protein [Atopobiaceae bacterium]
MTERTGIAVGVFYGQITLGSAVRLALGTLALTCALVLMARSRRFLPLVYRFRWPLALGLICLLVLAEMSGSSLAMWGATLGETPYQGTLLGVPRGIRSDEWLLLTPFSFSQVATGAHAVSDVIRGTATDVTMVHAQPAWCIATAFRPFLWGYLVLGASRGLSFFWSARAVLLVMVSFECLKLVADGRRRLAAYGAILVGFSPIVEWWFAVNGTAELFIFGQGLVLTLHYLLRSDSAPKRWGLSALLAWLLGCYALIVYPAWQVPLAYTFGALGVWDVTKWVRENRGALGTQLRALLPPVCTSLVVTVAGVSASVVGAWDALQAVAQTVYPGNFMQSGGGLLQWYANTSTTLLCALLPDQFSPNVSEASAFFSLFPLGILGALALLARQARTHQVDGCLLALTCAYGILIWHGIWGLPPLLGKLTLLNRVQTGRLPMALGYLDVALLVRIVCIAGHPKEHAAFARARHLNTPQRPPRWSSLAALGTSCLLAGVLAFAACQSRPNLMGAREALYLWLVLTTCFVPLLLPRHFYERDCKTQPDTLDASMRTQDAWLMASATIVLVAGLCVNPWQRGADALLQSSMLREVSRITQENPDALWITDNATLGQACVSVGAPTINSVNVYPDLERWRTLDPNGTYEENYNRFAHISLTPGLATSFENPTRDTLNVTITPEDALKLGATYWLSSSDLAAWSTDKVRFELVQPIGGFRLYKIEAATA